MNGFYYSAFVCVLLFPLASCWWFGHSSRQEAEGPIDEACIAKARRGDCMFYVCFDQRHPCMSNDYALTYGWRFCKRYDNNYSRFTPEAKRWINATRLCAMNKLLEFYRDDQINCGDVEGESKRVVADCEAEYGICGGSLLMDNKDAFGDVYKLSRAATVRFLLTMKECGLIGMDHFINWMRDRYHMLQELVDDE